MLLATSVSRYQMTTGMMTEHAILSCWYQGLINTHTTTLHTAFLPKQRYNNLMRFLQRCSAVCPTENIKKRKKEEGTTK